MLPIVFGSTQTVMMTIRSIILLILLGLILFTAGITQLSTTDRDGSRYAQASKQMVETGNYWQINFQNKPRHLKPPGIYWLQALSVNTLNHGNFHSTWAYRVPSLLGALLAALFTFLFGRYMLDEKTAFIASAMLLSAFYVTLEAHMISTDAMLMACVALMQGALWMIYSREKSSNGMAALFWIAMAAGILIKGLAPLFAILTIAALSIVDRDITWLKRLKFVWGLPLMLALSFAWLIPISIGSHSNFLMNMITQALLPKLRGGQQGHGMPPGFFFVTIGLLLWPGSLFLVHGIRRGLTLRKDPIYRFLLAWIIPSWIFFEIIPTKLPQYLMPIYPAIFLLMAGSLVDFKNIEYGKNMRILIHILHALWFLCGIGIGTFFLFSAVKLTHHWIPAAIWSLGVIVIASIIALITLYKKQTTITANALILGSLLAFTPLYQWTLPGLWPLWTSKRVASSIYKTMPHAVNNSQPLLSVGYSEPSLVFFIGTKRVLFTSLNDAMSRLAKDKSQLLLLNMKDAKPFTSLEQKYKLKLKFIRSYLGFNYNADARWQTLNLYRRTYNG